MEGDGRLRPARRADTVAARRWRVVGIRVQVLALGSVPWVTAAPRSRACMRTFGVAGLTCRRIRGPMEYDDIIVGGGSAIAVLAARRSEDPARKVMLFEAGPYYATVELTSCRSSQLLADVVARGNWGFTAEAVPGRAIAYPGRRVVGAPLPSTRRSHFAACLRITTVGVARQRRLELGKRVAVLLPPRGRPDGAAEVHGRGGPIVIRRWRERELIPTQRAFLEVCRASASGGRRPQPPRRDRRWLVPPEPVRPPADLDRDRLLAPRA